MLGRVVSTCAHASRASFRPVGSVMRGLRNVHVEARLEELGVTLPETGKTLGSYVPAVRTGNLVFTGALRWFGTCYFAE